MKLNIYFILLLFSVFQSKSLLSQNKEALEKKRTALSQEIDLARKILTKNKQQKRTYLHELGALNEVIKKTDVLITNLKTEVVVADSIIGNENLNLLKLKQAQLIEFKRVKLVVNKAYKSRRIMSFISFILSAKNFRQAAKRMKYLKKLAKYKHAVATEYVKKTEEVSYGIAKLENTKYQKNVLLTIKSKESKTIEKDKEVKSKLVKELSVKEKELKAQIRENEQAIAKLNSNISRLIAIELNKAKKEAQQKNTTKEPVIASNPKSTNKPKTTGSPNANAPKISALGSSFLSNKGKLPWPVSNGYISQSFGVHSHPDLEGITILNNGVDFTTQQGAAVKCVFNGVVSAILNIPGQQKAILISHGEYFTVYSRLDNVTVAKGDKVNAGSLIGNVWHDNEGKNILQFQVWNGQNKQDPKIWLAR